MQKIRPVDKLYKTIANAQKKIDAIRKVCKHKKSHIGLYSWRIGAINNARLCNACDQVLPDPNTPFGQGTTLGGFISQSMIVDNNNCVRLTGKCCDNGNFEEWHICQKQPGN
jgi:hypothetical protein